MTYVKAQARRRPALILMILLAGAVAYMLSTAFAGPGAATNSAAKGALKYVNVGAEEFQDDACVDGTDYNYGGYSGALNVINSCTFEAPASLPDKGKIASITVFYRPVTGSADFHLEANNDTGSHTDLVSGTFGACGTTDCSATFALSSTAIVNATTTHYGIYMPVSPSGGTFRVYRFRIELTNKGNVAIRTSFPTGTNG